MKLAVCPGSFDPITVGHLDVIRRASNLFDRVVALVLINPNKRPTFSAETRVGFIQRAVQEAGLSNVEVDSYDGLLAEYCRQKQAAVIVKGLRAVSDFEYEFQMALANRKLNPGCETMFLTTTAEHMYLSSSIVKQMSQFGGDISGFVPTCILHDIQEGLQKEWRNTR